MKAPSIPLGKIICERQFTLYTADGEQRLITVRLGAPVVTTIEGFLVPEGANPTGVFRCPIQILGLDQDERLFGAFGEDSFVALQFAIDLIGDQLELGMARLGLTNRYPQREGVPKDSWIWRYNSQTDEAVVENGLAE
jgi:hypothetical protein